MCHFIEVFSPLAIPCNLYDTVLDAHQTIGLHSETVSNGLVGCNESLEVIGHRIQGRTEVDPAP